VLEEGSSANGVWGGKLMWDQTEDLTTHFREILDRPDATLHTGIDELLGETPMVFVTRPDRVDQAVSLWKAVQTREWRHGDEAGGAEPQFSFAAIHHLAQRLEADDRSWRSWFAQEGIAPLTVEYDELSADPRARVGEVLAHLGLPDVDVPEPPTRRQGDETSRAWARRYREQAGARA
jgi:LPS sulfotransferase NodH